jgi:hypothetical protein
MASWLQFAMEETPRYEGAVTTTPYRVSTDKVYFPITAGKIAPGPEWLDRSDELRGIEGGPPNLIDNYNPVGSLAERGYLNNLPVLLSLCGLTDTVTAGNGVITDPDGSTIPAGAYRHVWTKRGGITAKTAQVVAHYEAEAVDFKGQGYGVTSLGLGADGAVTADLMGLVFANIAATGDTPAYDAFTIPPIRRGDLTIPTWLASTGVTADFGLTISNPLERVRSLNLATPSFFGDLMEHGDERVYLTGTMPKRRLADADVDAAISGVTWAAKARWKTPKVIGATAYKYSMWVEMPACQYTEFDPDELGNFRRRGGNFSWKAAWDEVAGYDFKITIVNAIASNLETYV